MYNLRDLRKIQEDLRGRVVLEDGFSRIKTVAGVDVACFGNKACGACVVLDYETKDVIEEKNIISGINFPYIPTYLSFREFPVIERVIEKVESEISVLMIDGNGVLHPRGMGLASHAGVLLDLPTIGVAKSLLCGHPGRDVEDWVSEILLNENRVGYAVARRSKNPIYVSPGHKISFESSLEVVKRFLRYRIPEPLRLSHILAGKFRI